MNAASPTWAGIAALAAQMRGGRLVDLPRMLGSLPAADFFDITSGSNGSCGTPCRAGAGYDLVTGRGSPNAQRIIQALAAYPNKPTDLDTPVVSISGVESGDFFDTSSGPVNVTVTARDLSGVSGGTLELLDRTGEVVWSTAVFAGCGMSCQTTATLPLGVVVPGFYTLRTRAVDSARNVGSATVALGV